VAIDINNLNAFVRRSTVRALREVIDANPDPEGKERRRQERVSQLVDKRKLRAPKKDERTSDVDEAEDEEGKEKETRTTGVPAPETVDVEQPEKKERGGGKGTEDSPKLDTPTAKQIEKASPLSVIEKLNVMRGGKSLKDPTVRKSFEQYFGGLGQDEKESLLIYLTALAQILAGVTTGTEAVDPSDAGLKTVTDPTKKVAIKKKSTNKKSAVQSASPADAPIVVGEQQRKADIEKILEAYRALI